MIMTHQDLKDSCFSQTVLADLGETTSPTIARFMVKEKLQPLEESQSGKGGKRVSYEDTRKLLSTIYASKHMPVQRIQTFCNFKGGTGKTSLCYQVGTYMALMGYNVLLVDLDPQAHLTSFFREASLRLPTLFDVINRGTPIRNIIFQAAPGLDLVPSNVSLTKIENELNNLIERFQFLNDQLDLIKDRYDFVFIDINPTISTLNRNAIFASDRINIICETQPLSLDGLTVLFPELKHFLNSSPKKKELRIIPNKYDSSTNTSKEVLGTLMSDYSSYLMNVVVRKCEEVNISTKVHLPVVCFSKKNSAAYEDMLQLAHALVLESCVDVNYKEKAA